MIFFSKYDFGLCICVFVIIYFRSYVVCPAIDWIHDETFALNPQPSPPYQGVFDWRLDCAWLNYRQNVREAWLQDKTMPLKYVLPPKVLYP